MHDFYATADMAADYVKNTCGIECAVLRGAPADRPVLIALQTKVSVPSYSIDEDQWGELKKYLSRWAKRLPRD